MGRTQESGIDFHQKSSLAFIWLPSLVSEVCGGQIEMEPFVMGSLIWSMRELTSERVYLKLKFRGSRPWGLTLMCVPFEAVVQ